MDAPREAPGSEVAAIGAAAELAGFALAGAAVHPAEDAEQVRAAWRGLPAAVGVVVLTPAAAQALGAERTAPAAPLTVVTPP